MVINSAVTNSEDETLAWAATFAQQLKADDTVALSGDLGAGKTVLCRGIARALGYAGDVHSPSYALVHEYAGPIPVFHMDLYRLKENADWEEIGLEHYLSQRGICLIEWPERLPDSQKFTYRVEIKSLSETGRHIFVTESNQSLSASDNKSG